MSNNVENNFDLDNEPEIDAIFEINATPHKVSELENDLYFQTADEVSASIQAESDVINTRIDNEVEVLNSSIGGLDDKIDNHIANTNNPHEVTKAQVGLGNCDNTSDINKPISTAQQSALDGKQPTITGGATTITSSDLTTARTLVSDNNGKVAVSNITSSELDALDDITGNIQTQFNNITDLIPSSATTSNQLADKDFVNSSVSTNTANFIGTFTSVSDLNAYSGTVTNNDYAFVTNGVITDNGNDWATFVALDAYDKTLLTNFDYAWVINGSNFDLYRFDILNQEWDLRVQNTQKSSVTLNNAYNRYKATVVSNVVTWDFEYTLNNSSFTAEQWLAINSGITAVTKVTHTANTAIGSSTQPVYINANGETVAISNTIAKSVPSNAVFTDTTYTIATGSANGTISVSVDGGTASDVSVKGLGSAAYTPSTDYATASQGSKADTAIQSVTTGSTNGTISVDGTDVSVYGLGSAAYTSSTSYATSAQGTKADTAIQSVSTGSTNGTIAVDGTDVSVYGLGSAAYTNSTAYATSTQGGKADSAIQTVKVNGSALTPDANKAVDITVPTDTQTTSNLVTSVSSASTDSQYPSAKLFYDTCGDIETLINAL